MAITVASAMRAADDASERAIEYIGWAVKFDSTFYEMQAVTFAARTLKHCRSAERAARKAAKAAAAQPAPVVTSTLTPEAFTALVAANAHGLADAVTLTPTVGGLRVETTDSHAAHAIALLARPKGLTVRVATITGRPAERIVLRLTGFTRGARAREF